MWTRKLPIVALLFLALSAVCLSTGGCGIGSPIKVSSQEDLENELHPKEPPKEAPGETKKVAAKTPDGAAPGVPYNAGLATTSIKGVVLFEGAPPKIGPIKMSEDCTAHHAGAMLKEDYVINDGKLANAVVFVSKGQEKWNFSSVQLPPARINQQGCKYIPHVMAMITDQKLEIESSDPIAHNIHGSPKTNNEFNVSQPTKGILPTKPSFASAEMGIPVRCDVHSWMSAWICVFEHPFFAVTKEDGSFEIKLPPGEQYEVSVWHEAGNKVKTPKPQVVKGVADGKPGDVKFTFSPK